MNRWDNYFLKRCLDNAAMSKDPDTQVGACVVDRSQVILSDGWNGFPRRIADTHIRLHDKEVKRELMVHAEVNAILNAGRQGVSLVGSTLYLAATDHTGEIWGGPPCINCTLHVIQAGIVEVVSPPNRKRPSRWHCNLKTAEELLTEAGIEWRQLK